MPEPCRSPLPLSLAPQPPMGVIHAVMKGNETRLWVPPLTDTGDGKLAMWEKREGRRRKLKAWSQIWDNNWYPEWAETETTVRHRLGWVPRSWAELKMTVLVGGRLTLMWHIPQPRAKRANIGTCPDQDLNCDLSPCGMMPNQLNHTGQETSFYVVQVI